jgi:hypothetical protein
MGSILQFLPHKYLKYLQTEGEVYYKDYFIKVIATKYMSIRKGKNTVHFYDMANFYNSSLNDASKKYLGEEKIDIGEKKFFHIHMMYEWDKIEEYCIQDAVLVKKLAERIISKFEDFGVYPRKLYSVAYVSNQYFNNTCKYIHVKRFWHMHRKLLDYAMQSYNGGKFEVIKKGMNYYYEYDIKSAYPYEMSNLVDIMKAQIIYTTKYIKSAVYAFMKCEIEIPYGVFSPVALKNKTLNYYPIGKFTKVITKTEYEYLIKYGCKVKILDGIFIKQKYKSYPYRKTIYKLMEFKNKFKRENKKLDYHTIKIFLNSRYGKMVQLIDKKEYWLAGSSWNPIYASVITANCRVRISEMQQKYKSVIAVHTDSIISTEKLPFEDKGNLGDMLFEIEGEGVVLGSGIYQIGSKSKFRGFNSKKKLLDILPDKGKELHIEVERPYSWREVAHRNMDLTMINRFSNIPRDMNLNFDIKRIWLDDYKDFSEVRERVVDSVPRIV